MFYSPNSGNCTLICFLNSQACGQLQTRLKRPCPLTIHVVFASLKYLSAQKGTGSMKQKLATMTAMLRACRECEMRILVRTLVQNMRIGASLVTIIGALGRAALVQEKGPLVSKAELDEAAAAVCGAYNMCPSLDVLVPALVNGGLEEVRQRQGLPLGCI